MGFFLDATDTLPLVFRETLNIDGLARSRHVTSVKGCALYPIAPVPALNVCEERYHFAAFEAARCLDPVWAHPRDFMCASPQFSSLFGQIAAGVEPSARHDSGSCSRRDEVATTLARA